MCSGVHVVEGIWLCCKIGVGEAIRFRTSLSLSHIAIFGLHGRYSHLDSLFCSKVLRHDDLVTVVEKDARVFHGLLEVFNAQIRGRWYSPWPRDVVLSL